MKEKIIRAFDDIQADDALIQKTAAYLQEQRESQSSPKRRPRTMRFVAAFAAALVLVVGLLGYHAYQMPVAYVSVDVNPSIEITINRFNTVIGAYSFNSEGEEILQQTSVTGKQYDDAVAILMTAMEREGYFTGDALISMTVQATDSAREQSLQDTLQQLVTAQAGSISSTTDVEVFPVSAEVRGEAHGCQMSPAKYLAIQELLSVDETATLEEYSGESIRQIRQRTRECQGEHGTSGGGSGNGNGNNSGQNNGQEEGQSAGQGQGGGQGNGQGNGHHGRGYHGGR